MTFGQRFARFATDVSVRWPRLWLLLRPFIRREFDRMAPQWAQMRSDDAFGSLEAALAPLYPAAPARTRSRYRYRPGGLRDRRAVPGEPR